jgi:acetyltransferase-like isoleucine patch superfamily enzyme
VTVTPPSTLPTPRRALLASRSARAAVTLITAALPWSIRRHLLQRLFGWALHPNARIGFSIVDVEDLRLGDGAHIGHANFISRLRRLHMGSGAQIGKMNWIRVATALAPQDEGDAPGELLMGDASGMTGQHFVDCSGGLYFGAGSMLGGCRTTIMTHQIDVPARRQRGHATYIGDRALVASNCTICPGTSLGAASLIAMGSNARGACVESGVVYAGNPARPHGAFEAPVDNYFNFT